MVRGGSNFLGRIDGVPAKRGFRVSWVRGPLALGRRCGPISTPFHTAQRTATPTPTAAVPIAIGYSGDALHTPLSPRPAPEVPQGRWTDASSRPPHRCSSISTLDLDRVTGLFTTAVRAAPRGAGASGRCLGRFPPGGVDILPVRPIWIGRATYKQAAQTVWCEARGP